MATRFLQVSEVEIDPKSLELEADAVALEHPAPPVVDASVEAPGDPVGQASPEQVLQGYKLLTSAVTDRVADTFMPAWQLTPGERGSFADACANALLLWFPDQILPPKYMALLVVAGVGLEIAQKRRDPRTGDFLPMQHAKPDKRSLETAAAPAAEAA